MPLPDKRRVRGQNWGVMQFAAPQGATARAKAVFIKVSGSFETEEEAHTAAKEIHKEHPNFDTAVFPLYQFGQVPPSVEAEPFLKKQYEDRQLGRVIEGQQKAMQQSKKEMDERIARDRARAEAEMRKIHGPDWEPMAKSETVKAYEEAAVSRDDRVDGMQFSHRELVEDLARFMHGSGRAIDPAIAGDLLRYLEECKLAPPDQEVCVGRVSAAAEPTPAPLEEPSAPTTSAPAPSSDAPTAEPPSAAPAAADTVVTDSVVVTDVAATPIK